MFKSIDRYILRKELVALSAVLVITTALLSLENVPRIWSAVSGTSGPLSLLLRMLLGLLPEYLELGILMGSFLAPAWVIRTLALRGEWQILAATGLPPWRIMLTPMLIGGLAMGGQMVIQLELKPVGERTFNELGKALESGSFGLPVRLNEFVALDDTTTIYVTPSREANGNFGGIFAQHGQDVFFATSANIHRGATGRIEVQMFNGQQIVQDQAGLNRVLAFASYRFTLSSPATAARVQPTSEVLKGMPLKALLGGALKERAANAGPRPLTASLLARLSIALYCLLLPWLAFVLAQPPRRNPGGAGIFLGVGAIALFLRTNAVVETDFQGWPIAAALLHLALWAGAILTLVRYGVTHEDGVIDSALNGAYHGLRRRWATHPLKKQGKSTN